MNWSNTPRPTLTPRRTILRLDCLEDRFAPALIAALGQTFVDAAPYSQIEVSAIGFFHPFSQNGFAGGEMIEMETTPAPLPRPVMPPRQPAAALGQPLALPEILEAAFPVAPPANTPPAAFEAPAIVPLVNTPVRFTRSASAAPVGHQEEQETPFVLDARLAAAVFASDGDAVTPAATSSRAGFATVGGLFAAASLLYCARNVRERRYDEFLSCGH